MRYCREQKSKTRQRIVDSALRLFAARGYAATSIDDIMRECKLTRGGFYAHFKSKSELYREAIGQSDLLQELAGECGNDGWIDAMLGACLSRERLGFFAADVANDEPEVRTAYTDAFKNMNAKLLGCTAASAVCSEQSVLSATAMIIGTLAVAHATNDSDLRNRLLASCRANARALLENAERSAPPVLFWAPGVD